MIKLIWKVELGLIILTMFFAISLFATLQWFNALVSLFLLAIICAGAYYGKIKGLFSYALVSLYAWFVGPFSIVVASFSPDTFSTRLSHSVMENINRKAIIGRYCLYLAVFYIVFYIISVLTEPFFRGPWKNIKLPKKISVRHLFPLVCAFSLFELVIRKSFSINIPGHVPTIRYAGVILYLIQALGMYFLFLALYKNIAVKKSERFIYYGRVMLIAIVTQLPTIAIGKRSSFFDTILIVVIYTGFYKFDIFQIEYKKRKKTTRIALFTVVILLVGIGITNLVRIGEFETINFLIQRFTGLLDGTIALADTWSYSPFKLMDYIKTFLFSDNITSNAYYTNYILGFPVEAIHSNALPIFIGSSFYEGLSGIVVVAIVEGLFFTALGEIIKKRVDRQRRHGVNIIDGIGLYCGIYSIWMLVTSHLIDGNITNWKKFLPIFICYFMGLVSKDDSRELEVSLTGTVRTQS
ncbi:hypothetical protein D6853_13135 [Butyrivibrio sp. X503]|uniref:hypothetical protein n=1 Tax=Butyrivibrio sp. X503 TaxID=2364878 RepID=UPI000EA99D00|nr:hypothetical protein [Butyrivibrio sp. X503]RKM54465.1 hypothetical protein D6853_13135 [Butyrivibrio sp. X503]